MKLRKWQAEAIRQAVEKYQCGQNSFLVLATPGAGKTVMSAVLTDRLFKSGEIDLVICITPSITVKNGFYQDLSLHTGCSMHGGLGSKGCVLTYQSLGHLTDEFWDVFSHNRVFVIFDEVHHCSGAEGYPGNAWGEVILNNIKLKAKYTLSLSGTPWRSDNLPITLAKYDQENRVFPDFVYGLESAVDDGVCRIPQIVVIDNDGISVKEGESSDREEFKGISHFLKDSSLPYQSLLENKNLVLHILKKAINLLDKSKEIFSDSAGLIVASSVEHAEKILAILSRDLGQEALLVTHKTPEASKKIEAFKASDVDWLISVGMVSEGTNIPRLQVCCHLSRIKTELHFRQVLGRVLRTRGKSSDYGYMVILAEDELVKFATRIQEDLPEQLSILQRITVSESADCEGFLGPYDGGPPYVDEFFEGENFDSSVEISFQSSAESPGVSSSDNVSEVSLFGAFMEELIQLRKALP